MGKIKKNWAEKNEEQNETSESEYIDSESEEEEESNMELSETSGDEDAIVVSNLFVIIIYIHIIVQIHYLRMLI